MMNLATDIGRQSRRMLHPRNSAQQAVRAVHISDDDYEYIIDHLFESCGGYFNEVLQVGPDCEYNLNLEGRIVYEMVYCGSSPEASEEASIHLDLFECRRAAYGEGRELDYMEGELVKTDFDPDRVNGESRVIR